MLIVQNTLVSDDIVDCHFRCNLQCCKGQCCVDGDCGAPLERDEIPILEAILPQVHPYMCDAGREAVERLGVWVYDNDFDPCTPLVDQKECAFVTWSDDGTAYCAIEQAYRDGKIDFMKPISCHLYPIRIDNYPEFTSLNYHQWDVCRSARQPSTEALPLYQYLKEPLIRKFGAEWYDELLSAVAERNHSQR